MNRTMNFKYQFLCIRQNSLFITTENHVLLCLLTKHFSVTVSFVGFKLVTKSGPCESDTSQLFSPHFNKSQDLANVLWAPCSKEILSVNMRCLKNIFSVCKTENIFYCMPFLGAEHFQVSNVLAK